MHFIDISIDIRGFDSTTVRHRQYQYPRPPGKTLDQLQHCVHCDNIVYVNCMKLS